MMGRNLQGNFRYSFIGYIKNVAKVKTIKEPKKKTNSSEEYFSFVFRIHF